MMKYSIAIIITLILILLCACSGGTTERTPETIRSEGILRVAAANENDYPYLFWDADGLACGIEPELMRRLAAALQADAEFIPFEADDVAQAVENGMADIGIAGFNRGSAGAGLVETGSYFSRRPFVLTRRGQSYPNEAVMSSITVYSDGSYPITSAVQADIAAGVSMLLDKSADAVICDEFAAYAALAAYGGELRAEPLQNADETAYVAVVSKQNEKLYSFISSEITALTASGDIWELFVGE
ncbi:MAG: transporter substrate-binding domain-containing protein [Oscillospiraceae bacterium]|nr:transporter substrate-binding domain-containing protein [Oscillospiraceae bacterium]